jgi:hypothetical protein
MKPETICRVIVTNGGFSCNPHETRPLVDANFVKSRLLEFGFAKFKLNLPCCLCLPAKALLDKCGSLKLDMNDPQKCRHRAYQKYVLDAWNRSLRVRPVSTYYQELEYNPQDGGKPRTFESLGNAAWNPFLMELVVGLFNALPINDQLQLASWDVGVHVNRQIAREGVPAKASPNHLHKDGEPFTAIIPLRREHIEGGRTIVAKDARGEMVLEDCILEPFEAVVVVDSAVWHHVTPIQVAPGFDCGYRDVMLIEFTPFRPDLRPLDIH